MPQKQLAFGAYIIRKETRFLKITIVQVVEWLCRRLVFGSARVCKDTFLLVYFLQIQA